MKIIVGGLPPTLNSALLQRFPSADIITMSCQDSVALWRKRMTHCSLCVISTRLISHKHINIVRSVIGNHYSPVSGLCGAVTAISHHLQENL